MPKMTALKSDAEAKMKMGSFKEAVLICEQAVALMEDARLDYESSMEKECA